MDLAITSRFQFPGKAISDGSEISQIHPQSTMTLVSGNARGGTPFIH